MKSIIVILLTISVLSACTNPNGQDLMCNLYVRYEQDRSLLKAEASFFLQKDNNERNQVAMDGGVAFLGSNMALSEKLLRYQTDRNIPMPEQLSFNWKNSSGTAHNIAIAPNRIGNFRLDTSAPKPTLELDAPRLNKNEKLSVLFDQPGGMKFNVEVNGPSQTGSIELSIPEYEKLISSPFSVALVRTQTYLDEQQNCTCTITQSTYSDWKEINLE